MKFPGGMNMQQMMKQAQQMQEKMQREMEALVVDATAGGGVVTVQMSGTKEVTSIKIDPEAVKEGDVEMLQDLIVAAVNEKLTKPCKANSAACSRPAYYKFQVSGFRFQVKDKEPESLSPET